MVLALRNLFTVTIISKKTRNWRIVNSPALCKIIQGDNNMLFFHMFIKYLKTYKCITVLLLSGVFVSVYCISVMLGIAVGQYKLSTSSNTYASLTIDMGMQTKENIREFSEYVHAMSNNKIVNSLYFSKSEDNVLIGWSGIEAQNWFPVISGNFFTGEEDKIPSRVAFVSDSIDESVIKDKNIKIADNDFEIKGVGWIVPWSFKSAMSDSFDEDIIGDDATESDTKFVIIPFYTYAESFYPEFVLIQFKTATYEDLKHYKKEIESKYSDCDVYMPDVNSDDVLKAEQVRYGLIAIILSMLAGVTVVRLMSEWIKLYKKEINVLRICGMRKYKCLLVVYGHWLIIYCLGSLLAVMAHYFSFDLLKNMYGDSLPIKSSLVLVLLLLYLLSVVCTIRSMKQVLDMKMKENIV